MQQKDVTHQRLLDELVQAGVSISDAQVVENDGLVYDSSEEVSDPGYIDPLDGTFKRPWCPATRILEHRENERIERCGPHGMCGKCAILIPVSRISAGIRRKEGKKPINQEAEIHSLLDGQPFLAFQKIPTLHSAMRGHGNSQWM